MSDQQGLGRRPDDAPDMIAPVTVEQPVLLPAADGEPRPWDVPPPPSRRRGPLAALAVFALILMAGVASVGFYLLSDEPHDHAGGADDARVEAVPPPPFEERIHADELYDGDWDFRLGETTASATRVGAWDHGDCRQAALFSRDNDRLLELGCTYRIEGSYKSPDGHAVVSEQVLVFDDQSGAGAAATDMDWSAYAFQPDGLTGEAVLTGGAVDVVKNYVIVTMVTIDTRDDAVTESAEKLLHWFHTDHVGVFHWK